MSGVDDASGYKPGLEFRMGPTVDYIDVSIIIMATWVVSRVARRPLNGPSITAPLLSLLTGILLWLRICGGTGG